MNKLEAIGALVALGSAILLVRWGTARADRRLRKDQVLDELNRDAAKRKRE